MSNFYDLLGVDRTASADQIRSAWKTAIADLDPTDPIFRAYSGAAEVLLDAERRAAYDADLAPAEQAPSDAVSTEAAPDDVAPAQPVTLAKVAPSTTDEPATTDEATVSDEATVTDEAAAGDEPVGDHAPEVDGADRPATGPGSGLIGAVAAAALLALVLAVFLLAQPGGQLFGDDSPSAIADQNAAAEEATVSAEGAAERMVPEILSYDYRTLDKDFERRNAHLTDTLRDKTVKLWEQLREDAVTNKLQVATTSEAAGLTRMSEDTLTAVVVVFFRQDVASNGGAAQQDSRWATFNLIRDDDESQDWLVDDVCVDSGCE